MSDIELDKFETRLASPKRNKDQELFEAVLAAAVAADRRGFFVEPQTVVDQAPGIDPEKVKLIWLTSKFQKSLADRGIKTTKNPGLTLRQETFLQAYLNPLNLKPPQVVAKQMQIAITELDGWFREKEFAEAMSAKAEDNLRKYIPMADQALGQLIQQGDMKAITFVNQLTGRYDPNAKSNLDIVSFLISVQEIIQKHVRDPITKRNVGRELMALAQGQNGAGTIPEPMPAAIMESETTIDISLKD